MILIKYLGYWGTPNKLEDEAMGLIPGKQYAVKEFRACCEDKTECESMLPVVSNERGQLTLLTHGEYEEENK